MSKVDQPTLGIRHCGIAVFRLLLFELTCTIGALCGVAVMVGEWFFYVPVLRVVIPIAFLPGIVLGALITTKLSKGNQAALTVIACILGFSLAFLLGWITPLAGILN